jgi:hypothetical protein
LAGTKGVATRVFLHDDDSGGSKEVMKNEKMRKTGWRQESADYQWGEKFASEDFDWHFEAQCKPTRWRIARKYTTCQVLSGYHSNGAVRR